ncbi:JmjC domain-containing protein [Streptomyces sp. N2A]|uniref:cupin domain-containing protein n=1 Tax=Streptomyces sp. N2A TaxID=3073936 RepID=UPI0028705D77|nr:cupin domain-containing protein [Streptomyces sp. N2A]
MFDLESLLDPMPLDQFLRENWTTRGVILRGQDRDRFRSLFSWDQLNHLLNFHRLRFGEEIRLAAIGKKISGQPETADEWIKHCQDGYTLIINQLQRRIPAIAALATAVERAIGHRSQVNMYCSWPEQQGFDQHHDDHEVFILQIEGTKRWVVSEETYKYPLDKYNNVSVDTGEPKGPPYIETELRPGDVLYIPRGHWHYAVAGDEPSLHLTLGVTCRTGVYWLKWLADELMDEEEWRRNLPPVVGGDTAQLADHVRGLMDRLVALAGDEQLVKAYLANHLTTQDSRHREVGLPSQSGFHPLSTKADTRLRQAQFNPVKVDYDAESEQHRLQFGTRKITLDGAPPELIDNLLRRESFTLAEAIEWAPGFDPAEDIAPLLRLLVEQGLLLEELPPSA